MNFKGFSWKYMLVTCRLDMLWLPGAFWALFLVLSWMIRADPYGFAICASYLGAALPLIAGILAAYAVLDDPALELQFAAPRPAYWMLLERLGMILALAAACALSYQAVVALLQIDLSPLGGFLARQAAWAAPCLAMIALGAAAALAFRQAAAGSALIGLVWMMQVLLRDLFLQSPAARYVLIFMGSNYPQDPALRGNQAALAGLAVLLSIAAWAFLRLQERYLT
jgi:hypothetical protein